MFAPGLFSHTLYLSFCFPSSHLLMLFDGNKWDIVLTQPVSYAKIFMSMKIDLTNMSNEKPQTVFCGFSCGLSVLLLSVQPLADEVCNHTSHDGNDETYDHVSLLSKKQVRTLPIYYYNCHIIVIYTFLPLW